MHLPICSPVASLKRSIESHVRNELTQKGCSKIYFNFSVKGFIHQELRIHSNPGITCNHTVVNYKYYLKFWYSVLLQLESLLLNICFSRYAEDSIHLIQFSVMTNSRFFSYLFFCPYMHNCYHSQGCFRETCPFTRKVAHGKDIQKAKLLFNIKASP